MQYDRRVRVSSLLALGLFACGPCGNTDSDSTSSTSTEPAAERETPPPAEALYDAEGNLLPGDVVIAGLTLPRGLEARPVRGARRHVYRTDVPLAKVQAYFGQRLITGEVDRLGDVAIFRRAVPQGVRGGVVHLDVGIHPIPRGGTRVEIDELAPPDQNPPNPEELIRRFDEEQRRLD